MKILKTSVGNRQKFQSKIGNNSLIWMQHLVQNKMRNQILSSIHLILFQCNPNYKVCLARSAITVLSVKGICRYTFANIREKNRIPAIFVITKQRRTAIYTLIFGNIRRKKCTSAIFAVIRLLIIIF